MFSGIIYGFGCVFSLVVDGFLARMHDCAEKLTRLLTAVEMNDSTNKTATNDSSALLFLSLT